MGNFRKVLKKAGPVLLPLAIAGIQYLLRRKRGGRKPGEKGNGSSEDNLVDTLVDAGLSTLTRGQGKRMR